MNRTRGHIPTSTTTSVQVVEVVVHLHELVVQNPKVRLNVLHALSMLMHELVEAVLGRVTRRDALFQPLERLVRLVKLGRKLELVEVKTKADILSAQGSLSS